MSEPSRRVRFDGTVTAGNLLTAIAMAGGLLVWGLRLESRVDVQARDIAALDRRVNWEAQHVQQSLNRIESGMQRIEAKIDGKADKQ